MTQFVRVPPYEILEFLMNFIFFGKTRQLYGVINVLPYSKLIIGKSQVFSTRSYVYLLGYKQICDNVPLAGVKRVNCNMIRDFKNMMLDFAISILILVSQADGEGQRGDVVLSLEHASHASQGQGIKFIVLEI